MANIPVLSSLDAPELDVYARLTHAHLRNRLEPEKGVFIAESPKVIRTALDAGLSPVSFLMEQRHIGGDAAPLLARFPDIPVYTADRDILAGLTVCAVALPLALAFGVGFLKQKMHAKQARATRANTAPAAQERKVSNG